MLEAHKYLRKIQKKNTFMNVCTLVKWRVSLQTKHVVILFYNFRDLFNNNVTLNITPLVWN